MSITEQALRYNYSATVVRWVDGDTVWLSVDLGFRIVTTNDFRLYGVDTPERGKPGYQEATVRCNELAPVGQQVDVSTYKVPDKYGRWLVDIVSNGVNVTATLIAEGLGYPYFGGTKAA